MAHRTFLVDINLSGNNLREVVLDSLASDPSGYEGRIYYNTATHKLRIYKDGAWADVGNITSVSGTSNEVEVSNVDGAVTIGLPDDVTIGNDIHVMGDATIEGDLTVNGTVTSVNTETVTIADNMILLNSNATGSATENAGIEVERGDDPNVVLRWNETSNTWEATRDGSTYAAIVLAGDDISTGDITNFTEDVQDAVGNILSDSGTIDFTYSDSTPSISAAVILATSNSYLSTTSGLAVDKSSLESALITDGFTKKVAATIGNNTNSSFAITHNLGTRDVVVEVYTTDTYESVFTEVVRTSTNVVTINTNNVPATDSLRVVITG